MSRPSRDTTSGRVYLALRARARRDQRPTDELLVLYVLERFLYRLSVSPQRRQLVLKGGMLLAALGQRRPTRDVDLLAKAVSNDVDTVAELIRAVVTIEVDDGVVYDPCRLRLGLSESWTRTRPLGSRSLPAWTGRGIRSGSMSALAIR